MPGNIGSIIDKIGVGIASASHLHNAVSFPYQSLKGMQTYLNAFLVEMKTERTGSPHQLATDCLRIPKDVKLKVYQLWMESAI
jgi:hypothetical protein